MNYLPRNRSRNSLTKPALILVGIFALGAIIFPLFDGLIISLISPIWRGENVAAAKLSGVGDFFRLRSSIIEENNRLKERVSALELEMASRFSGPVEGDELFQILGRRAETGGVVAAALVSPPQSPYDTIIIDGGENDGVVAGARAYLPEGPLLGIIEETYGSSARLRLFTTPGEKTAAVLERHGVPVTLEGVGGGNFKIVLSRETEVEVGDRILSADVFSHLLAVVGEVSMEPTDSFKDVLAKSPANVFNIHFVLVRP